MAFLALALGACSSSPGASSSAASGPGTPVGPVSGMPLPSGYSLDHGRSLILGEGDRWTGRFSFTQNSSATSLVDFYRQQMPGMGWQEISVVRAETSVLVYSSPGTQRVATIQIQPRTLMGSRVDLVVAPATQNETAPAYSTAPVGSDRGPAMPASPRGSVTSRPIGN
jgi:hypothetical protein